MSKYQDLMDDVHSFIKQYELISNSQIVDFFTKDLWEHCVPEEMKNLCTKKNTVNIEDLSQHVCIKKFQNTISSIGLNNVFKLKRIDKIHDNLDKDLKHTEQRKERCQQKFHSQKKQHEIEQLSGLINENIPNECPLVIDAGAGKGYLSIYISQNYNLPVLAIESSNTVYHSALNHKDLLKKVTHKSYQVKYVKEHINESTEYLNLVKNNFPDLLIKNISLVGLHTCGSLVYSMVKSFQYNKDLKMLCVVPCCYHLADSCFNKIYNISRNQRMLAQQRFSTTFNVNCYHSSLFYRAVLQVILKSLGLENAKIGRGVFHEDFTIYIKRALSKIGLPIEKIPCDELIKQTYNTYVDDLWKFNIFHTLRLLIAPLLEVTILLDIALHLLKNGLCGTVEIVRIFDNQISPRSFCILAKK